MRPDLLLVAHGTRDPAGAVVTERVAEQARRALPGVRGPGRGVFRRRHRPSPADALARLPGPVVAVPMFLAAGYHVRVDVPARLGGIPGVLLAEAFGPDPALVAAAADRLTAAGARPATRSCWPSPGPATRTLRPTPLAPRAGSGGRLGRPVTPATIAAGGPRVGDAVAALRAGGADRVAVASWLLAPGLFQRRLEACGADVVAAPLADHPAVLDVVLSRYHLARASTSRTA